MASGRREQFTSPAISPTACLEPASQSSGRLESAEITRDYQDQLDPIVSLRSSRHSPPSSAARPSVNFYLNSPIVYTSERKISDGLKGRKQSGKDSTKEGISIATRLEAWFKRGKTLTRLLGGRVFPRWPRSGEERRVLIIWRR